jgi:hypothetical protein
MLTDIVCTGSQKYEVRFVVTGSHVVTGLNEVTGCMKLRWT